MKFSLVGNGGNCAGCEWFMAEGVITKNTPSELEAELKNYSGKAHIAFHSPGGDLLAGLEMGRILRK